MLHVHTPHNTMQAHDHSITKLQHTHRTLMNRGLTTSSGVPSCVALCVAAVGERGRPTDRRSIADPITSLSHHCSSRSSSRASKCMCGMSACTGWGLMTTAGAPRLIRTMESVRAAGRFERWKAAHSANVCACMYIADHPPTPFPAAACCLSPPPSTHPATEHRGVFFGKK